VRIDIAPTKKKGRKHELRGYRKKTKSGTINEGERGVERAE